MSKSLAELRSSTHTALPERSYALCLSQSLVAEVQALDEEHTDLVRQESNANGEDAPPRRSGQGADPRIAEIVARKEELYEEMRQHTGELRLRGVTGGEWRRWVDGHPARIEGQDNNGRPIISAIDIEVAYGYANAGDLLNSLGSYAHSWNGEPMQPGDWDFVQSKAAAGDLKELCKLVVQMHEGAGAKAPLVSAKRSSTTPLGEPASS